MDRSSIQGPAAAPSAVASVLDRLLSDGTDRPDVAWENLEDVIYHDTLYGDRRLDDSPELAPFMQKVWRFNTAMQWVGPTDAGHLFAFVNRPRLPLTGEARVSTWHSGLANTITHQAGRTTWRRGSARRRDGLVLPAFQFHRRQHPVLEFSMVDCPVDWQLSVTVKGRAGRPLWHSEWQRGVGELRLDVDALLSAAGYRTQYAEVHIAIMTWADYGDGTATAVFEASFPTECAIILPYPVIWTAREMRGGGTAGLLEAFVVDEQGRRENDQGSGLVVKMADAALPMSLGHDGVWSVAAPAGLEGGEYDYEIIGSVGLCAPGGLIRVTDGNYYTLDAPSWLVYRGASPPRPLSGSYAASSFVLEPGQDEQFIVGQEAWDSTVVANGREERVHHWDSLTEAELDAKFGYLSSCGWDLLHLHQHWSSWARLDVGGHLSPHGAEQAALYYRVADRHGLATMQSLVDYPYGVAEDRTQFNPDLSAPWSAYLEAGFEPAQWYAQAGPFRSLFESYVSEYMAVFRSETAIFGFSHSGEADFMSGPEVVNATDELLKQLGSKHLFYSEPCFRIVQLPERHCAGFQQELVGGRTYWVGGHIAPHDDMSVELALMAMAKIFVSESSWAPANTYARLHRELADRWGSDGSWTGTKMFRLRLRDTLYLSLIRRMPLTVSWDEQIVENEHRVFAQVAKLVDWTRSVRRADWAIVVDTDHMTGIGRENLAEASRWFTSAGLTFETVTSVASCDPNQNVLELAGPFQPPRTGDGALSGTGYQLALSTDVTGHTVLGYLHNSGRILKEYFQPGNHLHRVPMPGSAHVSISLPAGTHRARVWDLNTSTLIVDRRVASTFTFSRDFSTHDYFLLLTIESLGHD